MQYHTLMHIIIYYIIIMCITPKQDVNYPLMFRKIVIRAFYDACLIITKQVSRNIFWSETHSNVSKYCFEPMVLFFSDQASFDFSHISRQTKYIWYGAICHVGRVSRPRFAVNFFYHSLRSYKT